MLHNLPTKSVYGFWRLSLAHFYCLCWVFPRVERHMTSAEGTWGCSVALEPQLHTALCWESVWQHRWMPECWVKQDFFIFIYFLSASSLWSAALYYAPRSDSGFTWSQPTALAWDLTRQENQNANGFHIGWCVKSHCQILALYTRQNPFHPLLHKLLKHMQFEPGGSLMKWIGFIIKRWAQHAGWPTGLGLTNLPLDQLPSLWDPISEESSFSWEKERHRWRSELSECHNCDCCSSCYWAQLLLVCMQCQF